MHGASLAPRMHGAFIGWDWVEGAVRAAHGLELGLLDLPLPNIAVGLGTVVS